MRLTLLIKVTAAEGDIHSSGLDGRVWLLGCRWWLQELGGWQQRGQLFGTLATIHVVAAVVADAGWMIIDEAELRVCDLGGRADHRSRCVNACVVQRLVCATA